MSERLLFESAIVRFRNSLTKNTESYATERQKLDYIKMWENRVDETRYFYIKDDNFVGNVNLKDAEKFYNEHIKDALLDLPFKCCWLEFKRRAVYLEFNEPIPGLGVGSKLALDAVWLYENDNFEIEGLYYYTVYQHLGNGVHRKLLEATQGFMFPVQAYAHDGITYAALKIVVSAVKHLNTGRLFRDSEASVKIKTKTSTGKKVHKINEIIYVGSPKAARVTSVSGKTLEYSHQFEVRGHWRSISTNSIGKDRNGKRCTIGRTWVSDFVKGDKEAPLISKIRVR